MIIAVIDGMVSPILNVIFLFVEEIEFLDNEVENLAKEHDPWGPDILGMLIEPKGKIIDK